MKFISFSVFYFKNKRILLSLFSLFFCAGCEAANSWYVVNNYKGSIGRHAVHLSLQSYDFGKNNDITGSYYYDKYSSPIALYGKQTAKEIFLCEASKAADIEKYINIGQQYDITLCPFKLHRNASGISGTWKRNNTELTIDLTQTASMNENKIVSDKGYLEIPFWGQTSRHAFIGVYEPGKEGVVIDKIKVIEKKSGHIIQTFNPQASQCDYGFFMTTIYRNLERLSDTLISLNCYSNKFDVTVDYEYIKNKFQQVN